MINKKEKYMSVSFRCEESESKMIREIFKGKDLKNFILYCINNEKELIKEFNEIQKAKEIEKIENRYNKLI